MDKKLTEKDIQDGLRGFFSSAEYVIENVFVFGRWESDVFVLMRSGYGYDIEIKTSRADYLADFKKDNKHDCIANGDCTKYRGKKRPNRFYFCVPEGLVSKEEVPAYAGLIYVKSYGSCYEVKKAPVLHKQKYDYEVPLFKRIYYRWRKALWESRDLKRELEMQKRLLKACKEKN